MVNELDLILGFVRNAGLPEQNETEILRKTCRKIINVAPTYCIEREIALRLEAQPQPIEENDLSARSSPMPILSLLRTFSQIWPCKRGSTKSLRPSLPLICWRYPSSLNS